MVLRGGPPLVVEVVNQGHEPPGFLIFSEKTSVAAHGGLDPQRVLPEGLARRVLHQQSPGRLRDRSIASSCALATLTSRFRGVKHVMVQCARAMIQFDTVPETPVTDASDSPTLLPSGAAVALDTEFTRGLGLFDSTMVVVGSMIGSGIFIVSAEMARWIGSPGWLLVAWLVTGLLTVAAALWYGELAAMMPRAGGQVRISA